MRKILIALVAVVGFSSDLSACYRAEVSGLPPYDDFLAVRTGPSTRYRQIDSLYNGDIVFVCNRRGRWKKVFYSGRRGTCFLRGGYPVGDCYSGWVYGRYVY
jgi:uncharacterized protein YraI